MRSTLQRIAVFDQYAKLCGAASANHDGDRCCQSKCTGTGDNQHGDTGSKRERQLRRRPEKPPAKKSQHSDEDNDRHENRRDFINQVGDGWFTYLRLLHHVDDMGQRSLFTQTGNFYDQAATAVTGTTDNFITGFFSNRERFAS
jgi:hypothetical protein